MLYMLLLKNNNDCFHCITISDVILLLVLLKTDLDQMTLRVTYFLSSLPDLPTITPSSIELLSLVWQENSELFSHLCAELEPVSEHLSAVVPRTQHPVKKVKYSTPSQQGKTLNTQSQ